jgi:hypothetical protein
VIGGGRGHDHHAQAEGGERDRGCWDLHDRLSSPLDTRRFAGWMHRAGIGIFPPEESSQNHLSIDE